MFLMKLFLSMLILTATAFLVLSVSTGHVLASVINMGTIFVASQGLKDQLK